jgi:DNA-binding NtrC family response regulator
LRKKGENVPRITVLVVEDDAQMVYLYEAALAANGFRVLHATSLEQAEEIIEGQEELDAVIIDGNVIGGKTTKLVENIKRRYENVKVVAATNDDVLRRELILAGADSHAEKHEAPDHLITILTRDNPCPA